MKGYYLGLILSLVLTLSAYFFATPNAIVPSYALFLIGLSATLQMLIQFVYFLRLGESEAPTASSLTSWSVIFFVFTILITIIIVAGSIWIMYNLNYRM